MTALSPSHYVLSLTLHNVWHSPASLPQQHSVYYISSRPSLLTLLFMDSGSVLSRFENKTNMFLLLLQLIGFYEYISFNSRSSKRGYITSNIKLSNLTLLQTEIALCL